MSHPHPQSQPHRHPHPQPAARKLPDMAAARAALELALWRHGAWLPLSLALAAAAAVFAWQAQELGRAGRLDSPAVDGHASAWPASAAASSRQAARPSDDAAWRSLKHLLAPQREATESVRRLVQLTQPELAWQQAEFQHSDETALGVVRLQISVPVQGSYRPLRLALDRALLEMPNLALDQLLLRRQQPGASVLEARLRFSLWLNATEVQR